MSVASASTDVIPNDQSQAEIFKLKMDHFEEIFDWLSLEDLAVLGRTCKRMQRIVGYYIKTKYAASKFKFERDGIFVDVYNKKNLNGLSSFLKKIVFLLIDLDQHFHMKAEQFKSLTEIFLKLFTLTDEGISRIKGILGQVETVQIEFLQFKNNEFFESFLQFCANIKKLCICGWDDTPFIGTDNSWLLRKYPTLEHFELTTPFFSGEEISELQTFFQQNPKIKYFATNIEIFLAHRNIFTSTELKLNVLSLKIDYTDEIESGRDLLNELYKRGLFKQLHVYTHRSVFYQEAGNQLISFNGLTKLFIETMENGADLTPLINLKHLCFGRCSNISNMAKELINLEFIQFKKAKFYQITQFIRYSPKLKTIVVFHLRRNDENILKIEKLNEERSKLANARKVTIYVEEHVYLRAKWAENQTNWSLIEIKRGASYDALTHDFEYTDYSNEMRF